MLRNHSVGAKRSYLAFLLDASYSVAESVLLCEVLGDNFDFVLLIWVDFDLFFRLLFLFAFSLCVGQNSLWISCERGVIKFVGMLQMLSLQSRQFLEDKIVFAELIELHL